MSFMQPELTKARYNSKQNSGLKLCLGAAKGMEYLHTRDPPIIHRDLKSVNVLFSDKGGGELVAKVSDFGESREEDNEMTMTMTGTPYWTAPEVMNAERYDLSADAYSFGIMLSEVVQRETPYKGKEFQDMSEFMVMQKVGFEFLVDHSGCFLCLRT